MAWFRAVEAPTVRWNGSPSGSLYAARTRTIPSQSRYFHITVFRQKEKSAPVPRLSILTDRVLYDELYSSWVASPNLVDDYWDEFFSIFVGHFATPLSDRSGPGQTTQESMRLLLLVRAYQVNGHMKAKLDPLALEESQIPDDDLDPAAYGFTEADLDRKFFPGLGLSRRLNVDPLTLQTLRSMLTRLEQAYCGSIRYEYMHIADREKCNWLRDKIERAGDCIAWELEFRFYLSASRASHGQQCEYNSSDFDVQVIRNHPSSLEIYQKKLLESGQVTKEDVEKIRSKVNTILNEEGEK